MIKATVIAALSIPVFCAADTGEYAQHLAAARQQAATWQNKLTQVSAELKEKLFVSDLEKEEFLYIGDSEVDMKVSVNAGVDCILLTYGFRNKEDLVKTFPYACYVDKAIDIIDYLK